MDRLYKLVVDGDKSAREELLKHLRGRFVLLARRRIGVADAEDIAQEACITVLEKLKSGHQPALFEAWAYQILRHKIGNYLQSAGRKNREIGISEDNMSGPAAPEPDFELRNKLRNCLAEVARHRPMYVRILNLTQLGYRTQEICKKLKVSSNNLYVMLNRSRKLLRDCLQKEGRLK